MYIHTVLLYYRYYLYYRYRVPYIYYRYSSECPIGSTGARYRDSRQRGSHPSSHHWGSPSLPCITLYALPHLRSMLTLARCSRSGLGLQPGTVLPSAHPPARCGGS